MALREINLVPAEILSRLHLLRHLFFWAGCLAVSLSVIFGIHLYQTRFILGKTRALTGLEKVRTNLSVRIEEIKRHQENLENITKRQSLLKTITGNQPFSEILLRLAGILNENTWFTQLSIDGSKDKESDVSLKLNGFSFSNEDLGDFLNRISNEPAFKAVNLKYARETGMAPPDKNTGESAKVIQFQIECYISRV